MEIFFPAEKTTNPSGVPSLEQAAPIGALGQIHRMPVDKLSSF